MLARMKNRKHGKSRMHVMMTALVLLGCLSAGIVRGDEATAESATGGGSGAAPRFEVALWVDHQDFATPAGGCPWDTVSPEGLEEIIDYCRRAGATTVYWRGFGGGLVIHNSKLEEGLYPQLIDKRRTTDPLFFNGGVRYGNCKPDIIGTVVSICRRKGLKCLIYWPWEDTHNLQCFLGRYSLEHPRLWDQRADGYASPARLSLAFREVRQYKLGLAQELLALGVDGFLIDYRRQSNWSPEFGYVEPAVAAFRKQFGAAPDPVAESWLRLRAAYQTQMLEELRAVCDKAGRPVEIIAAPPLVTPDPLEQLRTRFVDWPSWVALGLIDGLAPDGLPYDPKRPTESIVENMNRIRGMIDGRVKLYWSIRSAYDWGSGLRTLASLTRQSPNQMLADVLTLAWDNGAGGVHLDTFDPACETPEWIATLRSRAEGRFRLVNPKPQPAAEVEPVKANYKRPADVELPAPPVPDALEDRVGPRRLTTGPSNDSEARFSADGKSIVFQSDRGDKGMHLWIVSLDGGQPRQLTDGACHDLFPTFSPDGHSVAFCSDRADGRYYHLYLMPAAGGRPKAITGGNATDTLPCFSPDGRSIVFTSTRGTDFYHHANVLYEVPVAGGEPRTWGVLKYAQIGPTISRDARWTAFTALDEYENENFYVCVSRHGEPGGRLRLSSPNESCYGASISPDGVAVAYTSPGPDRRWGWDVWVRAVLSDALYRITNSAANDRSPSWSPDGKQLIFESNREGSYALYTIDVAGLQLPAPAEAEPWSQPRQPKAGWINGDSDPEHTPLSWTDQPRPALDFQNRSFGWHLGRKQPVKAITIVNDMPRGECRIDRAHTELYYGDSNGRFSRYTGPMTFTKSKAGGTILITLSGLDLTTTLVKVRFAYPDGDYTSVCSKASAALKVELPDKDEHQRDVRVWTTLEGKNQLPAWRSALGEWSAQGHELAATGTPQSDMYSGEGARIFLPHKVSGDFDFACQFFMPEGSTGAGGPVVYFRAKDDGSLYAFRYVNYWGTAVLQKKLPGQPWVEIGYASGRKLTIGQWHELLLRARGKTFSVVVDGRKLVEGRDEALGEGIFGLGCQVRPVRFRHIRISGSSTGAVSKWSLAAEPKPYVVVCADAGRGGYQAFPGLCRLKNGHLLAVFYAGWEHVSRPGGQLQSGGAVAISRSTDGGVTWSPAKTVLDTPLDDRDPAVWQCDDGTLRVSAVSVDWPNYKPPHENWCYAYLVRSTDAGQTWSQPEELQIGDTRYYTVWTEPRRLSSGEWLWPIYRNWGPKLTAAFLRSSDGGRTWGDLRLIDQESYSTDEPDVCQFPDGALFCAMRPTSESHMWQSRSTDNGKTWTRPAPLPFYGHCPNLLYTRSGVTLLGVRDPGMCIRFSLDEAKSWAGAVMIDPCGGAYSQMVELPDGRILVVYYTEGKRSQIRAQLLRVDQSGVRLE